MTPRENVERIRRASHNVVRRLTSGASNVDDEAARYGVSKWHVHRVYHPMTTPEQRRLGRILNKCKPGARRMIADAEKVLPRLLDGSATVDRIAAEYGIKPWNVQHWYERVASPKQRHAARLKKIVPVESPRRLPVGTERVHMITGVPVLMEKVKAYGPTHKQWIPKRRAVWERAHGPIKRGMKVLPIGDPADYSIENLKCLTLGEALDEIREKPGFEEKRRDKAIDGRRRFEAQRQTAIRSKREVDAEIGASTTWNCSSCGETSIDARPRRCPKCGCHSFEPRASVVKRADRPSALSLFLKELEQVA